MVFAEYYNVLQEESERVCGTALPVEIIHLILLKWGGLEHPAAGCVRRELTTPVTCYGCPDAPVSVADKSRMSCTLMPATTPRDYFLRHVAAGKIPYFDHPHAAFVLEANFVGGAVSPDYIRVGHVGYRNQEVEINANAHVLASVLAHCGVVEYWRAAAECRGLSVDHWMSNGTTRLFMPPYTREGKRDMYRLLLRAETDPSWRFWPDLFWPRRLNLVPNRMSDFAGLIWWTTWVVGMCAVLWQLTTAVCERR
jgi:hypothetical protein